MTTADAGTHNPDSCWVNAGMVRGERRYSQSGRVGAHELIPYEYGSYSKDGRTSYVMFWHLVQGVPQHYEEQKEGWRNGLAGRIERLPLIWTDLRRYGLNQKREQLFIRISANKPLDSFPVIRRSRASSIRSAGWVFSRIRIGLTRRSNDARASVFLTHVVAQNLALPAGPPGE